MNGLHLLNAVYIPQDIKFAVHAHPTLSEVLDELFKAAKVYTLFVIVVL
jgi:hypothetical protein